MKIKNIKLLFTIVSLSFVAISTLSFVLPEDILGKVKSKKQLLEENLELYELIVKNTAVLDKSQFQLGLQNHLSVKSIQPAQLPTDQSKEIFSDLKELNEKTIAFRNWINVLKKELAQGDDSLYYGMPDGDHVSKADVRHKLFDSLYYEGPRAFHLEIKADSLADEFNALKTILDQQFIVYNPVSFKSVASREKGYSEKELKDKELILVLNKLTNLQNEIFLQEEYLITLFNRYLDDEQRKHKVTEEASISSSQERTFSFESAALNSLYLNCSNPVSLNLMGKEMGELKYRLIGAKEIKGKKKGELVVIPYGPRVQISVSNNGIDLGKQTFKVKKIPSPTIEIRPDGKKMSLVQERVGFSTLPSSISVFAIPDAGFKSELPSEANYYVSQWKAYLVRGKRPVGTSIASRKTRADVSVLRSRAKPGDRITIEVTSVMRKNSLGKTEKINMGSVIRHLLF